MRLLGVQSYNCLNIGGSILKMVLKTSFIFDVTARNKNVISEVKDKLWIPQIKANLSCLIPLEALSSKVSLVGVSSENNNN